MNGADWNKIIIIMVWKQFVVIGVHEFRSWARVCYLRLNKLSHVAAARTMCHVGTTSAKPLVVPSSETQWRLTLTEPFRSMFLRSTRRARSDGRKLSAPSTFRTLAARHGEPSTNVLTRSNTSFVCALSQQTSSPRNSWRTGHTRRVPRVWDRNVVT